MSEPAQQGQNVRLEFHARPSPDPETSSGQGGGNLGFSHADMGGDAIHGGDQGLAV